jgi:hypothetical protein
VLAYIDVVLIATIGSNVKHLRKGSMVYQLFKHDGICVEIDICIFDVTKVPFREYIVSGNRLHMESEEPQAIGNWPRPMNEVEVQQILGLWNVYRKFVLIYA